MFDSVRKHQRLLQFVLLLLIFPAFALFGLSGYDRFFSDSDAVATVDGSPITKQAFDAAQRQQIEQMRNALGDAFDPAMLKAAGAQRQILDGLIVQHTLAWAAQKEHVAVSDAELRDVIASIPGLKDSSGKFDRERYRTLLAARGLSEAGFEQEQRRELALRALPEAIGRSVTLPPAIVERLLRANEQTRTVLVKRFSASDFVSKTKASAEDFRAYFDAHPREFEIPESAKVEYLVLGPKDVQAGIEIEPKELRAYYDQNPKQFGKPEERRASHILVAFDAGASDASAKAKAKAKAEARAKAEALLKEIRAGADFAKVARESSDDAPSKASGGDLGFFRRDGMVDAVAKATFAIDKVGEVVGPVESEFGWHLIKLTGIHPSEERPFEQVRPEIEKILREQKARLRFGEMAEGFSNTVYEQADSLEPAAKKYGLKVQTAEGVGRNGLPSLGADSPLNKAKLLRALFSPDSISRRQNTEAVDIGDSTLVSARIVDYTPARVPKYEEVEAEVAARVKAKEATELARKAGEEELKALVDGKRKPDGFGGAQTISRMGASRLPPAAAREIFSASRDKLPVFVGAEQGSTGYAIYQVSAVHDPSAAEVKERLDAYKAQLAEIYGQARLDAYFELLRSQAKVVVHEDRLRQAQEDSN